MCMLFTPIYQRSLSFKPVILPDSSQLELKVNVLSTIDHFLMWCLRIYSCNRGLYRATLGPLNKIKWSGLSSYPTMGKQVAAEVPSIDRLLQSNRLENKIITKDGPDHFDQHTMAFVRSNPIVDIPNWLDPVGQKDSQCLPSVCNESEVHGRQGHQGATFYNARFHRSSKYVLGVLL
ncbi:hypothetical protein IFM89_003553 [Coptis chinensis]|uniref:Uncharacterized protein n=1 Tax=Coptis chinensis TaxID=261450 RepID=A0A835LHG9_9MAGN|nr:hypothetical protein IFM89_003553 [Coptis chinensis]